MRVVVEVFREVDGRLQGVLEMADGRRDAFRSTLDLLRVLEGLELTHDPTPDTRFEARNVAPRDLGVQDG
jgi:hypothetical protein